MPVSIGLTEHTVYNSLECGRCRLRPSALFKGTNTMHMTTSVSRRLNIHFCNMHKKSLKIPKG